MSDLDQLLQQRRSMGRAGGHALGHVQDAPISDAAAFDASVPNIPVPDALMARILADAAREQPRAADLAQPAAARAPVAVAGFDLWGMMAALFGGRGVVAGLASVACAGIYLGAAQPSVLMDLTATLGGFAAVDQLDFMPSIDVLLAEE
jgi:hypothetical protein